MISRLFGAVILAAIAGVASAALALPSHSAAPAAAVLATGTAPMETAHVVDTAQACAACHAPVAQ